MKNKKLFAILTLVCFMFTLMPVAAFADTDVQKSYVYVNDAEVEENEDISLDISLNEKVEQDTDVYVWFEKSAGVPSTALVDSTSGVLKLQVEAGAKTVSADVKIDTEGTYYVHAVVGAVVAKDDENLKTWADVMDAVADYELQTQSGYEKVVVSANAADSDDYVIVYDNGTENEIVEDGDSFEISANANGIEETVVTFTVHEWYKDKDDDGVKELSEDVVYAYDIELDPSSKVSVNDLKVKRDGTVTFHVVADKAGTHKIKVTIGDFKATIKVDANDGVAETIEVDYVSQTPINIKTANNSLVSSLRFAIYDANGNELTTANGFSYAADENQTKPNYVSIVEQPAKSDLENDDVYLAWEDTTEYNGDKGWTIALKGNAKFEEEGDYTFKVALNDGTSAKATLTIKEAGDPVALSISYYTNSVQLGAAITPRSIGWLDANNVFTGNDGAIEFAASGAAVYSVSGTTITVKDDEKYVGSEILVTVVDAENNLIATKTLTVASEAKELVFDTASVPVDTTRTIGVKLVDEDGNAVSLTNVTTAEAYAIVLAKPADCDVTAKKGSFNIEFSADAVGTVTVQAVLKAQDSENVVRYYTGTQTINVGMDSFEDVVVMSIGSKEIVVNDAVKTIDAAPMISNNRTFVPFRALAEAFGATVAYDEATQAVTAELDGVTVVMTIGSATYTVNGVEKTADVAPFINDSRTMVPVRFVAQEFGVTVTPTYDDNGATADVVFAK